MSLCRRAQGELEPFRRFFARRRVLLQISLSNEVDDSEAQMHDVLRTISDRSLLVVEDDDPFRDRLARALQERGFSVRTAGSIEAAMTEIDRSPPAFALVDLRLDDGNGLAVIAALKTIRPDVKAVVLTGYGNARHAVAAVRGGALDYLPKPCTADDVFAALINTERENSVVPDTTMTPDRVQWEHIQRIYAMCNGNVSETARQLNMYRRTLQRILAKRAPR